MRKRCLGLWTIVLVITVMFGACSKEDEEELPNEIVFSSEYDGVYKVTAYEDIYKVATWKITIDKGLVKEVATEGVRYLIISGSVSNKGLLNANSIIDDDKAIQLSATFFDGEFHGTWSDGSPSDDRTIVGIPTPQ